MVGARRLWGAAILLAALASRVEAGDPPAPGALAAVEGAERFPGTAAEKERLARDGVVVLPRFHRQIFSPYIGGALPYYVTCDSVHHTYHVLFEKALRETERGTAARVRALVARLHERLAAGTGAGRVRALGAPLALAHAAVARRLLGDAAAAPKDLEDAVAAEVGRVQAAAGHAPSPLFAVPEDYARYRPRSFYAGDATLEAYFRAVTWLGRRGFRVEDERETAAALVLVRTIETDETLRTGFEGVDALLRFLVGPPDDLSVAEYAGVIRDVAGADDAALDARFADVRTGLARLRVPEINADLLEPVAWRAFREKTKGLRLMPSRATMDAWLFQALVEEDTERGLPTGLEVALALGSGRAGAHLDAGDEHARRAAEGVRARAADVRRRLEGSHYGATLSTAAMLFDERTPLLGAGAPTDGTAGTVLFPAPLFRSAPWRDRLLTTGLASWASLRHATALHAKVATYALAATQDPAGVVEPAPAYYAALGGLATSFATRAEDVVRRDPATAVEAFLPLLERMSQGKQQPSDDMAILEFGAAFDPLYEEHQDGWRAYLKDLVARLRAWRSGQAGLDAKETAWVAGLALPTAVTDLRRFAELAERLRDLAERELRGEPLRDEDEAFVRDYGKGIAELLGFAGNSWLDPDRQMGLVADVAADPRVGAVQEAAVGAALELYVVLPLRGGGHRLHQGAVYSYYAFPEAKPLTDAEWVARIEDRRTPPLPPWTASYVAAPDVDAVVARIAAGEVVPEAASLGGERLARAMLDRLKSLEVKTREDDRNLQWLLDVLPAQARGPIRAEVWRAVLDRLHRIPHDQTSHTESDVVQALARMAEPADRTALVAEIASPPAGSEPRVRGRLAEVLLSMEEGPPLAELEPLATSSDADVRAVAVELILGPKRWDEGAPAGPETERAVRMLVDERDASVRFALLDTLGSFGTRLDRRHAPAFAKHLDAADARVRAAAAALVGHTGGPEHATRLSELLKDPEPAVAAAAAEALGGVVRGAEPAALADTARRLQTAFYGGEWKVAVGVLHGLGRLGGRAGADALGSIARDGRVDVRLRGLAVGALGETGEPALPDLFRLSFDETETGNSVNSHQERLCDLAAGHLHRLLEGRFGWDSDRPPLTDESRIASLLDAIRAEARRRGHAPERAPR